MFFEYAKKNLALMPVYKNKKNPVINDWQKYSHDLPSEEELDTWTKEFKNFNCGIVLGPASGIVALDIDTDSEDTIKLCPYSPVAKRGKKGETRFFKYTEDIVIRHFNDKKIDILSTGSFTVLPPSVHPDGMKYEWTTKETLLTFDLEMLPILDMSFVDALPIYDETGKKASGGVGGRNNKLKEMITAAVYKGKDTKEIAKEAYEYDKNNHMPRLFTDKSERFKADTEEQAFNNAMSMVFSISRTLYANGKIQIEKPVELAIDLDDIDKPSQAASSVKYPLPLEESEMHAFIKLCDMSSHSDQSALSMGGVLALYSTLLCHRFYTRNAQYDIYPNNYYLNLANSGGGKETSQSIIRQSLRDTQLLGSGSYKSATSIIQNLSKQQCRIDLLDEVSSVFKSMSGKESFQSDQVEILNTLWSSAVDYYSGVSLRGEKSLNFGACHNPCVNILGSTTLSGFKSTVTKEMSAKGLMPRFLTFIQFDKGPFKRGLVNVKNLKIEYKKLIESFLEKYPAVQGEDGRGALLSINENGDDTTENKNSKGFIYTPRLIPMTQGAEDLINSYRERMSEETRGIEETFEYAFKNRFAEHACKLALISAVSCQREEITYRDAEWAISLVEAQWINMRSLYEDASADNNFEGLVIQMLKYIASKKSVSHRNLLNRFRIPKKTREDVIAHLIESEKIEKTGSKQIIYVIKKA